MKKSITLMLLLAIAGSANAGIVLKTENRISYCPSALTTSGKTIVYTYDSDKHEVTVYTPDFLVDKTFNVPVQEYQSGSVREEATVKLTHMNVVLNHPVYGKTYSLSFAYWIDGASSQEEMISKLQSNSSNHYIAFTDAMGNPACYRQNGSFKYPSIFGEQYPTEWYALIDGTVFEISTGSYFYTPAYDEASAVWTRTSGNISTDMSTRISETNIYFDGISGDLDLGISQNLFNNDDKWEYLLRDCSNPEISYDPPYITEVNEYGTATLTRNGYLHYDFAIYNEDGEKLGNIPFSSIYLINGKPYAGGKNEYVLYSILSDGGDIDLVEAVRGKDTRSLGARRGIVTVDINDEQAGGEVVVSTPDGKVMANKKVFKGVTQVNDRPLPTGIYVVSLLKDGKVIESEKYLVQ